MTERTHRVLVADDDESVRESLRKLLHGEGYQVVSVANGAEAVETSRLEPDQIDLLLVEYSAASITLLRNNHANIIKLSPAAITKAD